MFRAILTNEKLSLGVRTYVLHELPAHWSDIFAERGTEHHDLFLYRCHSEDFLDVASHI